MNRNRTVLCMFFSLGLVLGLYAEAPELRNVMPTSWRKVTRLPAAEEERFMLENDAIIRSIDGLYIQKEGYIPGFSPKYYFRVYRQNAGPDTFYRIIGTEMEAPSFQDRRIFFIQSLVYQNRLVTVGGYGGIIWGRWNPEGIYCGIDIIEGNAGAKGVLVTHSSIDLDFDYEISSRLQGRPYGFYYRMDGIRNAGTGLEEIEHFFYGLEDCPHVKIDATPFLVDREIPLRYGLQNAFDGDPATSYVENTGDDMMTLKMPGNFDNGGIKRLAIINGYAQNTALYKNNNRVKSISMISRNTTDVELLDNMLVYQFVNTDTYLFVVTGIFRGEKYNDTCIAEVNLYTGKYGWLFGDIDE